MRCVLSAIYFQFYWALCKAVDFFKFPAFTKREVMNKTYVEILWRSCLAQVRRSTLLCVLSLHLWVNSITAHKWTNWANKWYMEGTKCSVVNIFRQFRLSVGSARKWTKFISLNERYKFSSHLAQSLGITEQNASKRIKKILLWNIRKLQMVYTVICYEANALVPKNWIENFNTISLTTHQK